MRNLKDYLIISLKGVAMGAADVIPGVSGGTIAFITGIYEELINSIKAIYPNGLKLLLKFQIVPFWKEINGNFLASLVGGIAFSIITLARLLKFLLEQYPIMIWSFFFGLIVASAIYVFRSVKQWNAAVALASVTGVIIAAVITSIVPAEANTSWYFIIFSGAIAICAMILPGISGSFILVLLGMYKFILDALSSFELPVILLFILGAIIGIVSFSNLLSWLLRKFHDLTIGLLAGFMFGSLNKVWPWKVVTESFTDRHGNLRPLVEDNVLPSTFTEATGINPMLIGALLMAAIGFLLIFMVEGLTKPKKRA